MTTTIAENPVKDKLTQRSVRWEMRSALLLCVALTLLAFFVHGYHPYAEDGGIYLAGLKYSLQPGMFLHSRNFVTAHLHFSIFFPLVAQFTRFTSLQLMNVMLMLYLGSIFFTLFSAYLLAREMFEDRESRCFAVTLLASTLTVPVAGTSLMLMDPYVTARSFATPFVLVALTYALKIYQAVRYEKPYKKDALWLVCMLGAAVALHPLTGGYGAAMVLLFAAVSLPTPRLRALSIAGLSASALCLAWTLDVMQKRKPPGYSAVAQARSYWFLSNWTWYEVLGIVAPLLILTWLTTRRSQTRAARTLLAAAVAAGVLGCLIALLFVHQQARSYGVARVQPLRILQVIYLLMLPCLGASLQKVLRKPFVSVGVCATAALMLFVTQRSLYQHSAHLELPWVQPSNPWEKAFEWVRENTPMNAVIAIDADYITAPGEDAQNFRAISERSTPADRSKDGGIAAIRPELTSEWLAGVDLQKDLNGISDAQRHAKLIRAGIGWVVLPVEVRTSLMCPYRNEAVVVCRMPASMEKAETMSASPLPAGKWSVHGIESAAKGRI